MTDSKRFIGWLFFCFITYLMFVFVTLKFDCTTWDIGIRLLYVFFTAIITLLYKASE